LSDVADNRRFAALVDAHGASVMGLLCRLCGNRSDAEDLFQDVAVRVWRNIGSCPTLRNPRAWLMVIAYRTFLDRRQQHAAVRQSAIAEQHEDDASEDESNSCTGLWTGLVVEPSDRRELAPDAAAARKEEAGRLQVAIGELSDGLRQVVSLHYSGGLTLRETAAAMELSEGTVKSRLNAAINKLRSALQ
jgi:RNA polymerase sigma-70 factor (ECF subfamily)